MMVHSDEAGDEYTADILDILEGERCLSKLAVRYLYINHLVNRLCDSRFRIFGKAT